MSVMQFTMSNKDAVYIWASSLQMNVYPSWDDDSKPVIKIPSRDDVKTIQVCRIGDYLSFKDGEFKVLTPPTPPPDRTIFIHRSTTPKPPNHES